MYQPYNCPTLALTFVAFVVPALTKWKMLRPPDVRRGVRERRGGLEGFGTARADVEGDDLGLDARSVLAADAVAADPRIEGCVVSHRYP
jgi:hypothetical protein